MTFPSTTKTFHEPAATPSIRRRLSLAMVVATGMVLTFALTYMVRTWEKGVVDAEFERRATNHTIVLQARIEQHVELLESLAGLYAASNVVERGEFHRFVQPILARHSEVQGYGWNPRVRHEERASFEAAARRQGLSGFQITELGENGEKVPAVRRDHYVPAFYLEPLNGNEQAIGYDIASEDTRREALESARDSGQAFTTRWIRLLQETEDHYGILIVRPVFAEDSSLETIQQRRDALRGYLVGVFRIGDMLENAIDPAQPAGLDFWVGQPDASPYPAPSYFHPSRTRTGEDIRPRFTASTPTRTRLLSRVLRFPGQEWSITYAPAPAFFASHARYAAIGVLLAGIVLTALLGLYLLRMQRDAHQVAALNERLMAANDNLQREIAERVGTEKALSTSEQIYRGLVENAPEAITILDVQRGHLIEANPHTEELFQLSRQQLLRIGPTEFSPEYQPDGRRSDLAAREYIQRAVDGDTPVFEWMHRDATGRNIPCEVRLLRLPDPDHVLVRGTILDIRDRKRAESLQERLGRILDNSTNEIYVFDAETLQFEQVSAGARVNLGYSAQEIAGMTLVDIKPAFSKARFLRETLPLVEGEQNRMRFRTMHQRKDGTQYPVEVTLQLSRQETPPVFVAIVEDITERLAAEKALRESEAYNRTLFEESPIGLLLCDREGNVIDVNPAFAAILGRSVEETKKLTHRDFTPEKYADDEGAQIERLEREGGYGPYEKEYLHKDGHLVPVRLTGRILKRDGRQYIWSSVEDITEYKQARDRIDHLAFHDALTDLPNRELLRDRLKHAIQLSQRNRKLVGVMFLDIDRFKTINDSLGHSCGDQLLRLVAGRLRSNVREADTVARFGGDEFVVIVEGLSDLEELEKLAGTVIESMKIPFHVENRDLFVTTSIGIALGSEDTAGVDALISQADMAMYRAKESGRNNYQVHSADMGVRVSARAAIESDLRGALERNELLFYLQPILTLDDPKVLGMEALMRWKHPQRGLVNPAAFIPVMEDSGMIVPASRWILEKSCRYLAAARKAGQPALSLSVNFSAPCLYETGIVDFVQQALADCGLAPADLTIEITESTLFQDPSRVNPVLQSFKEMGVQIALDDFGTGQSSLSHLRQFHIDIVKIDRTFIRDIPGDSNDCQLVSAIIAMAHRLKKHVVAEGVENDAQLAFLRQQGCDRVQGYLFSPPLPTEEIPAYLSQDPMAKAPFDSPR